MWADTTDIMFNNFGSPLGGSYPFTMVVRLDTMEIEYLAVGDIAGATSVIESILAEEQDPCVTL